jgi:hypothetical protein
MAKKRNNGKASIGDKQKPTNKNVTTTSSSEKKASGSKTTRRPFESFPLHLVSNDDGWKTPQQYLRTQELVPGRVLIVPEFFSPKECQEWVSFCESSGGLEYTAHPATKFVAHRECFRLQQANATVLARRIFERMKSLTFLPRIQREMEDLYQMKNYEPVGCNPNLRVYKYEKGHSFGKHVDGSNLVESSVGPTGRTEWTVLIYLSECQGGATRFYSDSTSSSRKRKNQPSVAFEPQIGAMLLHLHGDLCLEHEADPVLGGTKFVLRTDLVFGGGPSDTL